jgi:hypothetical protein
MHRIRSAIRQKKARIPLLSFLNLRRIDSLDVHGFNGPRNHAVHAIPVATAFAVRQEIRFKVIQIN